MSMYYTDLVSALSSYLTIQSTEPNFVIALPRIIEQAELRCYRDIDFMATRKYATATAAAGTSTLGGPSDWLIGRYVTVYPTGGTARARLDRRGEDFLQEYWPDRTVTGTPKYWTELSVGSLLFAPSFATSYTVEMAYTYRPVALSATNTSTWLSLNAPDMFLYAALVAGFGYSKNFGAQSDDPRTAMTWEQQYQQALANATREEARRKGEAVFDTVTPPPATTQTHGA